MSALQADVVTLVNESLFLAESFDFCLSIISETELARNDDVLSAGKFVFASAESFESVLDVLLLDSDGGKNIADFNSASLGIGFTPCTSHTSLKTIRTSAGQHFVDSKGVPWVLADSEVETILGKLVGQMLIGGNTTGFKSFRGDLFTLVRNEMNTNREVVEGGLLESGVVESELGVGTGSVIT